MFEKKIYFQVNREPDGISNPVALQKVQYCILF